MKHLFTLAVLVFSAPAAAAETCPTGSPEDNIALAKRFYQAINAQDGGLLEGVLADEWRDIPLPPGQGPGRAGMQTAIEGFDAVFRDFHVTNDEFIASANKVVVRSTNTGVHAGNFAGFEGTGKPFSMTSIDIHTICDGRIVESQHVEDWLGTMFQLGLLPPGQ